MIEGSQLDFLCFVTWVAVMVGVIIYSRWLLK